MEPINILNRNMITNQPMTGGITSSIEDLSTSVNFAIQFTYSGTAPVGTLAVGVSNDGINFDYTLLGAAKATSGNSGTIIIKDSDIGYKFVQALYTFTSGTGTLNAIINGKRV